MHELHAAEQQDGKPTVKPPSGAQARPPHGQGHLQPPGSAADGQEDAAPQLRPVQQRAAALIAQLYSVMKMPGEAPPSTLRQQHCHGGLLHKHTPPSHDVAPGTAWADAALVVCEMFWKKT